MEQTQNSVTQVSDLDLKKPKFYISDIIRLSWQKVMQNIWFFIGLSLIILAVAMASEIFGAIVKQSKIDIPVIVSILIFFVFSVLQVIIKLGSIKIGLAFVDGRQSKILDLFNVKSVFWKYLMTALLYGLIIFGGLILFIIPGIIWGIKYSLFPYYVLEGSEPMEALKKSGVATHGSKLNIFLLGFVLGVINLIGLLLAGVGLLVTIPIQMLAMAYVYRALQPLATNSLVNDAVI